ncbi:hypothetical protein [Modestobacter versicolor]|uniref:hypothetical protein n=1 Tax=Modestobacter versicolor TaxID=429133 RepID=UPI0034DF62A4
MSTPGTAPRHRWRWWHDRWSRHLVAALERRLEAEACAHDGVTLCRVCRLVTCVGFLPASAVAGDADRPGHG